MKKILIVEDVDLNLDLLVQLLEDDYDLLTARDGAQGVALAASQHPDLILMDMSLPVIDGWTATQEIKANPERGHNCVINHRKDVLQAFDGLTEHLGDIRAAVAFGQGLSPEIRDGVLYMWLGYGRQTINRLGLNENA